MTEKPKRNLNAMLRRHDKPVAKKGINGLEFSVPHPNVRVDHFRYSFHHAINVTTRNNEGTTDSVILPLSVGVDREMFTYEVMEIVLLACSNLTPHQRSCVLRNAQKVISDRWIDPKESDESPEQST